MKSQHKAGLDLLVMDEKEKVFPFCVPGGGGEGVAVVSYFVELWLSG